jgi:putative ABC transport system substrate-binding protein
MIDRRKLALMLGMSVLATPLASLARSPEVPRVELLISETVSGQASRVDALRLGLRDRGYVEGKNIVVEIRSADGNYDLLPRLAAELVTLKVDVIVAFGTKAVVEAMRATTTIPIVEPIMGDPVALGLVATSRGRKGTSPDLPSSGRKLMRSVWNSLRKRSRASFGSQCLSTQPTRRADSKFMPYVPPLTH